MTSETFVLGCPIQEKVAIDGAVRKFAATLGPGHVEALVENHGNHLVVRDAIACPLTAQEQNIRAKLETHLKAIAG